MALNLTENFTGSSPEISNQLQEKIHPVAKTAIRPIRLYHCSRKHLFFSTVGGDIPDLEIS